MESNTENSKLNYSLPFLCILSGPGIRVYNPDLRREGIGIDSWFENITWGEKGISLCSRSANVLTVTELSINFWTSSLTFIKVCGLGLRCANWTKLIRKFLHFWIVLFSTLVVSGWWTPVDVVEPYSITVNGCFMLQYSTLPHSNYDFSLPRQAK